MAEMRADALVIFGAAGDLGYKRIFPALVGNPLLQVMVLLVMP
jgi:glucose-6-phosphate 1-dehydrogenase